MKKRLWFGVVLFLVLSLGGGIAAWQPWNRNNDVDRISSLGATYVVDRGNLSRSLTAYGEVKASDETTLTFPESKLKELYVQLGDAVGKGDVLAVLDATQEELSLTRAERALAVARADGVPTTIRERELEYEIAKANFDATTVRAPFGGLVVEAGRATGTSAGQYRIVILDRSELSVHISLSEADVAQVRPGQRATVTLDALPGRSWQAEIVQLGLRATQASGFGGGRVVAAVVRLRQPDTAILPGFSARVEVIVDEARGVLRVPVEALVRHTATPPLGETDGEAVPASPVDTTARLPEGSMDIPEGPASDVPADRSTEIRSSVAAAYTSTATSGRSAPAGNWAVYIVIDGESELRPVEIGLTTVQFAEVRSGLSEGDVIVRYPGITQPATGSTAVRSPSLPGAIFP